MLKRLGYLMLLTMLTIFGLALKCEEGQVGPNPCDDYKSGRMRIEHDQQAGWSIYQHEFNGDVWVSAFKEVGTEVAFCEDDDEYFTGTDTTYFDSDSLMKYEDFEHLNRFFQSRKTLAAEYFLGSLKGSVQNKTRTAKVWGLTAAGSPNVPPSTRWSFVFVRDVLSEPSYGRKRTLTYAVVHELGHQRAGLTHPEEHPEYHFPEPNEDCIMHSSVGLSETVLTNMGFCAHDDATPDNCRYFLKQRNR
ncbi:MAG: hypothetical protein Q8O10_09310 [candidate division Zixibacteria bacterium]|nr:hypothetical protein [candidate division Zixibacteria bacterium]